MAKYRTIKKLTSGGQGNIFICERESDNKIFIYKSMPCKDLNEANHSLQGILFHLT